MTETDINNTTTIRTAHTGNGLAATSVIPVGSLILKITNPYLILLQKAHLPSTCSWCFKKAETTSLKHCTGCKALHYCSPECQKQDWQAIHKKECKILKSLPDVPPTATRGLMQLSLRHKYGNNPDPRWEGLVMNDGFLAKDQQRFDGIALQAMAAAKYTGRGEAWMSMGTKVLCQMSTNAFRVTLPDDTPIGLCFEPTMAMANHCCSPNAVVVFDGRAVSFRSLTEIKQGEEIFISYIDPTQTLGKRRSELQHRYFFTCSCTKCTKDENAYETFLRTQPQEETHIPRRIEVLNPPSTTKTTAQNNLATYHHLTQNPKLKQAINSAQQHLSAHLSTTNSTLPLQRLPFLKNLCAAPTFGVPALTPYPSLLHNIYLTYLDLSSYIPALICLLSLSLNTDPYTYPAPHHPVRVTRLFTIAKLLKFISGMDGEEIAKSLRGVDEGVKREVVEPVAELDWFGAWRVVMCIVAEEVGRSHGVGSRFTREVEEEVDLGRGGEGSREDDSAVKLGRWMVDGGDEEGKREAERVVGGLKRLADCVQYLVGLPL